MPDTLITAETLRSYFDISADINDTRLTPHVGAASRRLKKWVGAEAYADALSNAPIDALRKADLQNAEAALAMHFAVPGLNSKVTTGGVVKTTREGGAAGAPVILTYLTPNEVAQLARIYLDQAEEIARPYLATDTTPDAEFAVVEFDDVL
jgi:hypothetical protein